MNAVDLYGQLKRVGSQYKSNPSSLSKNGGLYICWRLVVKIARALFRVAHRQFTMASKCLVLSICAYFFSQKFLQCCLVNNFNVHETDNSSILSFKGRSIAK